MKVDFGRIGVGGRAPALDAFRGCFVLSMFAAHVARFVDRGAQTPLTNSWSLVLRFEPAISAGFLFVVGVSLELSWSRACAASAASWRGWYARLLLRALTLYLVGVVLFWSQYGFELPDALLSPDILSAIAVALVLVGLALRGGSFALALLVALVLGVVGLLQAWGVVWPGVNGGPGGALPVVAFSALGVMLAKQRKRLGTLLGFSSAATLLGIALPSEWVSNAESSYAEGPVSFWNHTTVGVLLLAGPMVFGTWLFFRFPKPWGVWAIGWLRLLGRHALLAYLAHLVLLESTRRVGLFPMPAPAAVGYLACLVFSVCALLLLTKTARLSRWLNRAGELVGVRF